ncbi:MAG: hypothetical protein AAGG01_00700 [Planctomycetota bacterium]
MLPFSHAVKFGLTAAAITLAVACSGGHAEEHEHGEHGHAHSANFGGTLVELGDHFANVELTHDAETGEVALYTYDAHAEGSQRSSTEAPELQITPHVHEGDPVEPFTLVLEPRVSATSGEKVGDSSKFTGQHDSLKGLDHFEVTITEIELKGQTFTGVEFMHPSDAHDHDHDEEGHGEEEHGEEDHDGSEG